MRYNLDGAVIYPRRSYHHTITPKHLDSEPYSKDTVCDREKRTFQIDGSMSGERKSMGESCKAVVVKISGAQNER